MLLSLRRSFTPRKDDTDNSGHDTDQKQYSKPAVVNEDSHLRFRFAAGLGAAAWT